MQGTIAVQAHKLLSHLYGVGAHLAAATLPGAAHLLVCVWTVTRAFPRMIGSPILSPPWFPVLPRLVSCPSPIGGGSIRRGLDIIPSHCAQYAQAQAEQQKTCKHVQAPSMTRMGVEAGRDAMRNDLRLCTPYNSSSWSTNRGCSGVSTAWGIKQRTHWRASAPESPKHRFARYAIKSPVRPMPAEQ